MTNFDKLKSLESIDDMVDLIEDNDLDTEMTLEEFMEWLEEDG